MAISYFDVLEYLCKKIKVIDTQLISLFVPEKILKHFDYEKRVEKPTQIFIHLVEKNDPAHYPQELKQRDDIALDGYLNPIELQTFPAKGKEVFLVLKRRRWKIKGKKTYYYNTYQFNKKGMKATEEFGAFLKEIGRG